MAFEFWGVYIVLPEMQGPLLGFKCSTFILNIFFKSKNYPQNIAAIKPASSLHAITQSPDVPMISDTWTTGSLNIALNQTASTLVNHIFVFNHVSTAQKLRSELALKGKLDCNKYIHILITLNGGGFGLWKIFSN